MSEARYVLIKSAHFLLQQPSHHQLKSGLENQDALHRFLLKQANVRIPRSTRHTIHSKRAGHPPCASTSKTKEPFPSKPLSSSSLCLR
jgi:hypothetical protein